MNTTYTVRTKSITKDTNTLQFPEMKFKIYIVCDNVIDNQKLYKKNHYFKKYMCNNLISIIVLYKNYKKS